MADDTKPLVSFVLGGAIGAFLLKNHYVESRKSAAERDDPDGVEIVCEAVGRELQRWRPPFFETEDEYSDHLCWFLAGRLYSILPEDFIEEDDAELVECRRSTEWGTPDILIADRLVLELKLNPNKAECDRLVGQCCGYSREWVTWAVVLAMAPWRVEQLEATLRAKSLHYIEVVPFVPLS